MLKYKQNRKLIQIVCDNRIDSSKGYEIGNVQFISTAINYMKNTMSHEDTIKLCNIIAQKYSGDGGIR